MELCQGFLKRVYFTRALEMVSGQLDIAIEWQE